MKPFKAPGQTLDAPRSQDAVQTALDDAAANPLHAEAVVARSVKTASGRALRITGSIRNSSTMDDAPMRLSVFIKDTQGHAIGEAQPGLKGLVKGGQAAPFDLVVSDYDFDWLPAGSLDKMASVAVLVE